MKNIDELRNLIIAHRGIHDIDKGIAENSMSSFQKAVGKNYPIEFDVQMTKDKQLVVCHDTNLKRLLNIDKLLKDCTYDEIKDLSLQGTNDTIPLLKEVLSLIDGKVLLDIEIKDLEVGLLEEEFVKIMDRYSGRFIVKSFSPIVMYWFYRYRPSYIRGQLASGFHDKKMFWIKKFLLKNMWLNFLSHPDFIAYQLEKDTLKRVKRYRKKGIPIFIWTIRSEKELIDAHKIGDSFLCEYIFDKM